MVGSFRFSILLTLAVACCKPAKNADVPPPLPLPSESDVGLTTPLGKMCAHLREIHCPEGDAIEANGEKRTCYQTMSQAQHNAPIEVECVLDAKDRAAVRKCGNPKRNITIRCDDTTK